MAAAEPLRLAIVAGTLGRAGAEKQLVFLARSLRDTPVDVKIFCLTRGEFYQTALEEMGYQPIWIGQHGNPLLRLRELVSRLRTWRPHVIHSTHFYTNLYAGLAGRMLGALSTGSSRADPRMELSENPGWGPLLARITDGMIANSYNSAETLRSLGLPEEKVHVLLNVIDLAAFDRLARLGDPVELEEGFRIAVVGRLIGPKRVDRFLRALCIARQENPSLYGYVIGDGPLRAELEAQAASINLFGQGVQFLGARKDVPALLSQMHALALTSDMEGFPNVILEAMAARLPVVATQAGDAPRIVQDGVSGWVTPLESKRTIADRLLELAANEDLRQRMGCAGREIVERSYRVEGLAERMLSIDRQLAQWQGRSDILNVLEGIYEWA